MVQFAIDELLVCVCRLMKIMGFKWDEENAMNANELQMLKEDNAKLRNKIMKEKEKRRRVEEEIKAMKKEHLTLKLKAANN